MKRLIACLGLSLGAGLLVTGTAVAHPKVHETVHVHVGVTVDKASDGTLTIKAVFTASNPRCLSAAVFRKRSGEPLPPADIAGGSLEYGRGPNGGSWAGEPVGDPGLALHPASSFGRSHLVWAVVLPGSTPVEVVELPYGEEKTTFMSTVSAAPALAMSVHYPHRESGFTARYDEAGKRVLLSCVGSTDKTLQVSF